MRIRTIKPEFFEDERLAKIDPYARLLFIGLWMMADKHGVLEDRPVLIRSRLFPYGSEKSVSEIDTDGLLGHLASGGFIERYVADGKPYIWVPGFCRHQRITGKEAESETRCPLPPQELRDKHTRGNNGETPGAYLGVSPGNNGETPGAYPERTRNIPRTSPGAQEGKGKGKGKGRGKERKGMDTRASAGAHAREQGEDDADEHPLGNAQAITPPAVIPEDNPFAPEPVMRPTPAGPTENDPGMPADLWRMGIQGRQWARSLVTAGAKIGPQNWPAWWGILVTCYGATPDQTNHQALVDLVDRQMVRKRVEAWPDEARRLVEAAQAEEREQAKPGKKHYVMDDTDGVMQ